MSVEKEIRPEVKSEAAYIYITLSSQKVKAES
jgi:hypothetical protein